LQLAHYERLLEALGFAATDGRFAAIIGTERQAVWHDLDAAIWRTPSLSEGSKLRTTMERYDSEFSFRLDIIAAAQQHLADPGVELLVVPVRCSQCPTCPWSQYCTSILETPPGDVSLLPRVGWRQWKAHRERGITDRAQLAELDWRTASLIAANVNVERLMRSVTDMDGNVGVGACAGIAETTITKLHAFDVVTVADVRSLDAMTARYWDAGMASLPEQIDQARAAIGPSPVYRRRGIAELTVPRADVEVDIDMENVEDGVYLWGNLATDRSTGRGQPAYVPFCTWEPLTNEVETRNSLRFWRWLMDLRSATRSRGLRFAAFCYNASAENRQLRRLGLGAGIQSEIEAFIASDEWVDMLRVVDSQLITGGGIGLKVTAPLAGFSWSVDDAGGTESMVMHDIAVAGTTEKGRQDARRWLLSYNEGDVRATYFLREWMVRDGASIPSIG
jgi:predicted RecB family nuclease